MLSALLISLQPLSEPWLKSDVVALISLLEAHNMEALPLPIRHLTTLRKPRDAQNVPL